MRSSAYIDMLSSGLYLGPCICTNNLACCYERDSPHLTPVGRLGNAVGQAKVKKDRAKQAGQKRQQDAAREADASVQPNKRSRADKAAAAPEASLAEASPDGRQQGAVPSAGAGPTEPMQTDDAPASLLSTQPPAPSPGDDVGLGCCQFHEAQSSFNVTFAMTAKNYQLLLTVPQLACLTGAVVAADSLPRRAPVLRDDSTTVFVKNMNFKVTDKELWDFFTTCGTVTKVAVKRNEQGHSKVLLSRIRPVVFCQPSPMRMIHC